MTVANAEWLDRSSLGGYAWSLSIVLAFLRDPRVNPVERDKVRTQESVPAAVRGVLKDSMPGPVLVEFLSLGHRQVP